MDEKYIGLTLTQVKDIKKSKRREICKRGFCSALSLLIYAAVLAMLILPLAGCSVPTLAATSIMSLDRNGDRSLPYSRYKFGISGICYYDYDSENDKRILNSCVRQFPLKLNLTQIFPDSAYLEAFEPVLAFEPKFNHRLKVATIVYIVTAVVVFMAISAILAAIWTSHHVPISAAVYLTITIFALLLSANIVITTGTSGLSDRLDKVKDKEFYMWKFFSSDPGMIVLWITFICLISGVNVV